MQFEYSQKICNVKWSDVSFFLVETFDIYSTLQMYALLQNSESSVEVSKIQMKKEGEREKKN